MRRFNPLFPGPSLILGLILLASFANAADPDYSKRSKTIMNPSVQIPDKVLRYFDGRKGGASYFGALALTTDTPKTFFVTSGMNSAQTSANIAKIGCDLKSNPGQTCAVAGLSVPENASVTYAQAMGLSAVDPLCKKFWQDLRAADRRAKTIFLGCAAIFIRPEGDSTSKTASNPGHTLYVARNDLYTTVITYGANAAKVKELALKGCAESHAAFMKRLRNGALSWNDPAKRVSNRRALEIERRAILAYVAANPKIGACRIVGHEVLP